jgi:menaquinone-dependent protoporphyrinogen oxidase
LGSKSGLSEIFSSHSIKKSSKEETLNEEIPLKKRKITRRDFLKITGIALGGTALACGGLNSLAAHSIVEDLIELETPELVFGEGSPNSNAILLAYATYAGSTLEIASAIGKELAGRGFRVDIKPMRENPALDGYQAVILGSAVQYGSWLPEAVDFVKENQEALTKTRLALFTVHITNLEENEESRTNRLAFLNAIRPFVQPEAEVFFAGRFNRRGAALLLPKLIALIMPEMDRRDWKAIRTWGKTIFT